MSRFIVDTNVVSEIWKPAPDANVDAWVRRSDFSIPSVVVAELHDGIEANPSLAQRTRLNGLLDRILEQTLVLSWDDETARIWGRLRHSPVVKRNPQPLWDSLLDAIAVQHNAVIVSRNASDFRHATVFDPWTGLEHPKEST